MRKKSTSRKHALRLFFNCQSVLLFTRATKHKHQNKVLMMIQQVDTSFWANFQWTPQHICLSQTIWVRKPQKVPKEVSTYFSLNLAQSETLLLPKIPPGHFPVIVMLLITQLGYILRFSCPNGLTERYVLRCPLEITPKRGFHLLSIIRFPDFSFLSPCFGQRLCSLRESIQVHLSILKRF